MLHALFLAWPVVAGLLALAAALACSVHILLHKRNEAAAVAWLGVVWLSPFLGPLLYLLLGINRIARRAVRLSPRRHRWNARQQAEILADGPTLDADARRFLLRQAHLLREPAQPPFIGGNRVTVLDGGDAAYAGMLEAIGAAERSIGLLTYIMNDDAVGRDFAAALAAAVRRGVQVRVLIDGVGAYYSLPTVLQRLERAGVPARRFLHSLVPWRMPYLNLRTHKKILVVDGRLGFTGGMNLQAAYRLAEAPRRPFRDVHFRVAGPLVRQMAEVFAEDWAFTADERLSGRDWFPPLGEAGPVLARGLTAGPDEEENAIRLVMLSALAEARRRIAIVTPYFLPDEALSTALRMAALRGVDVDILLPGRSNLPYVQWATTARMDGLLAAGCRVWQSPPPFDHAKLFVVDDAWVLLGSANWDPRSLRLNFEFDVECFDAALARETAALVADRRAGATPLTLEMLAARSLPVRLRDGAARLFTPYL